LLGESVTGGEDVEFLKSIEDVKRFK